MAINSYFFNAVENDGVYDRVYNADDFTSYLDLLVGNGVFPNPSTQLQVAVSSGMNVVVRAGSGWINGHKMVNTADLTLSLSAADVLLNRIDDVIFYVDYGLREMGIEVKEGTEATTPSAPALQRDSTRYEMCLAQITVNKQTAAITAAMIKDTRGNSNLCGYVQGLIQQMDSSTMFNQWQAAFDEWFGSVQSQFTEGKLFKKFEGVAVTQTDGVTTFDVSQYVPQYSYVYDILEVFINGIHLTGNEYTLSNNLITLKTPIEKKGATVDFVVYKSIDPDAV